MSHKVLSPLPGKILDIKVSEGQAVHAGDCIVVLEAMKMENDIPSDFEGTVTTIKVEKGKVVQTGEVLVEIG